MKYRVMMCLLAGLAISCGRAGYDPSLDGSAPGSIDLTTAHVTLEAAFAGNAPLDLGDAIIDTTALTIDGVAPADGIVFDVWPQPLGGDLAVLHTLELQVTGIVQVIGTRPLAIVAGGDVVISGLLDAGARESEAGPGGAPGSLGAGAGAPGLAGSAGGGAGGAESGGAGAGPGGGAGGAAFGSPEITVLQGGSGGGLASDANCTPLPGGGGGGAVEIVSLTEIRIGPSGISSGGGGGGNAGGCSGGAGSGGGSGGAIYLKAPQVTVFGGLAANGGGGGGAGTTGVTGQDGTLSILAAQGGPGFNGAIGGDGGSLETSAQSGGFDGSRGGGGGGAVGRIRIVTRQPLSLTGFASPAPDMGTF